MANNVKIKWDEREVKKKTEKIEYFSIESAFKTMRSVIWDEKNLISKKYLSRIIYKMF